MENIEKGELITTGKAKSLYQSNQQDYLVMHYRDDTSAFDGKKIESLEGKGTINNKFNAFIMNYLEKEGIQTHFVDLLNDTDSQHHSNKVSLTLDGLAGIWLGTLVAPSPAPVSIIVKLYFFKNHC